MKKLVILSIPLLFLLSRCDKNEIKTKENESVVEDSLNIDPCVLPNPALVDFSENELNTDIISSFKIMINYMPETEISVEGYENQSLKYSISYTLIGESDEIELEYELINDSIIILDSKNPLIPDKTYSLKIYATWQKRIEMNGEWIDCATKFDEEISLTIITSVSLVELSIVESDFVFQYPIDRQFNYLKKEYQKGYFKLINEKHKHLIFCGGIIKLRDVKSGLINNIQLSYNESLEVFEYDLQEQFFDNEKVYEISLLQKDTQKLIYSYYFKTSMYNSFSEKWEMLKNVTNSNTAWMDQGVQKLNVTIHEETLDYFESNTNRSSNKCMPLIQFETQFLDSWKQTAEWQIYSHPSLEFDRQNSIDKKYGFPPLRAGYYVAAEWWAVKLSNKSTENGDIDYPEMPSRGIFIWEVQNIMKKDADSAKENALRIPEAERTEWQNIAALNYTGMSRFWINFTGLGNDDFPKLYVLYVIPGINIETTLIKDVQL